MMKSKDEIPMVLMQILLLKGFGEKLSAWSMKHEDKNENENEDENEDEDEDEGT